MAPENPPSPLALKIRKPMNIMGAVSLFLMVFIVVLFVLNLISSTVFMGLMVLVVIIQSLLTILVIVRAKRSISASASSDHS